MAMAKVWYTPVRFMITEEGDVEDIAIAITAEDAAGNTGTASVTMVTLDNTDPMITDASIDMTVRHEGW